jgi:hypothetical protein
MSREKGDHEQSSGGPLYTVGGARTGVEDVNSIKQGDGHHRHLG